MILVVIEVRFWTHVRFIFVLKFVSKLLNASKVHPLVPKKHYIPCMKRTIAPWYSSNTCFHRRLTVPRFSSIPFSIIYTFVAQLLAYIRPCIHTHMHKYIHKYIHACMHIHMHDAHMHTCIHTHMHTYINATHQCMHTCMHAYVHQCNNARLWAQLRFRNTKQAHAPSKML